MNFAAEMEGVFTQEEIESFLKDEQQFYIEYAETNWLDRYFNIKAMSQRTHVPSITSVISDTPCGASLSHMKTEQSALRSRQSSGWLDTLFYSVESLDPAEQKLI